MDLLDFMITFTIIYNIAIFGCFITLLYIAFIYIFGLHNIEFEILKQILIIFTFTLVGYLLLPYLLVVVFDFIMYIFYIIITTIIPETGILTLFIPVRELLMKIPPLKVFEERGIFRLFSAIFEYIGMYNGFIDGTKTFLNEYYLFSKNNTYELIRLFNPYINIEKFTDVIENMNNNNKTQELTNINNDIDV